MYAEVFFDLLDRRMLAFEGRREVPMAQAPDRPTEATFERLLQDEAVVAPRAGFAANAHVPSYDEAYAAAEGDPEGFWADVARGLEWAKPWDRVLEWEYPYAKWFVGA